MGKAARYAMAPDGTRVATSSRKAWVWLYYAGVGYRYAATHKPRTEPGWVIYSAHATRELAEQFSSRATRKGFHLAQINE